ncbi:MAG: tetratricopeptide repeat protein [Bryobacteraceae bacterium]|jgi:serine/threonine-protein kinase
MKSATESSERDAHNTSSSAGELTPELVRATLDKILASPGFANAERLTRFLRYTVEETLNGQTDKLKESLLGIDVFGRKPTYDPRVDAVVRTEAVKLRARLRDYYESEGREDEIIIDLPKGGYVPVFRFREKEPVESSTPAAVASPKTHEWKPAIVTLVVLAVLVASISLVLRTRSRNLDPRPAELSSIAVLPFADLSPEKDQEYFCDGMAEEIIDALSKIGGIRVVARTSSFAFKGKQQDIREIGKKLNVAAVLEGSVRKDGNRLRVTAQLNSVADGYHLWSETYERELKDVFTVQDEISRAIVNTLQLKLSGRGIQTNSSPESVETYELYLQGRYHWRRWRTEGAEQAIHYFEAAIQKDPKYAPAYAGVAYSYCWLGFFGAVPPTEAMPKARQAAEKALALDDSLAAAHTALAYVKALYEFDWPVAEREFKRAIELNAGDADAHFGYGIAYLSPQGRLEDTVREMQLARDLDPLSPVQANYLGLAYQFVGRRAEAIAQYKRALDLDPNFVEARLHLANAYLDPGRFKDFYAELDRAQAIWGDSRIDPTRAFGMALEGRKAEALELVHKCEKPGTGAFVQSTYIANVYAVLGDKEQMYTWLEKAYADRDGMLVYANKQGCYRPYRSEPRFVALLRKLGLPPAH